MKVRILIFISNSGSIFKLHIHRRLIMLTCSWINFIRGRFQYGHEPVQDDCHFLSEYLKVVCSHDILPSLKLDVWNVIGNMFNVFCLAEIYEGWHLFTSNWCKTILVQTMCFITLILGIISVLSLHFLCSDVGMQVNKLLSNCCVCIWTSWIYPWLLPAAICVTLIHAAVIGEMMCTIVVATVILNFL